MVPDPQERRDSTVQLASLKLFPHCSCFGKMFESIRSPGIEEVNVKRHHLTRSSLDNLLQTGYDPLKKEDLLKTLTENMFIPGANLKALEFDDEVPRIPNQNMIHGLLFCTYTIEASPVVQAPVVTSKVNSEQSSGADPCPSIHKTANLNPPLC